MASWDLAGSFVIGGLALLILMGIFFYYTTYTQHNLANEIAQMDISTLNDVMERDFNNVGNVSSAGLAPAASIVTSAANDFKFKAQLDASSDLDTVRYYTRIKNNDTLLVRYSNEGGSPHEWTMKVSCFKFLFRDGSGTVTSVPANVRSIYVDFLYNRIPTDSKEDYSKKIDNISLRFQRKYYPKNLYQ